MSYAYRCEICKGEPKWALLRRGNVVNTWSCGAHLDLVAARLQRLEGGREPGSTELVVTLYTGPTLELPDGVEFAGYTLSMNGCARCDGDGHADLVFLPLEHPVDKDGVTASHWAPCPTNGEPILLFFQDAAP